MQIANKSKCDNGEISCGILALHISRPELDQRVENNLLHPDEEQIVPAVFVAFTDRMTQVPLTSCKQYANERLDELLFLVLLSCMSVKNGCIG